MLKSTEEKRKIKKAEIANSIVEAATPLIREHVFTKISIQDFCEEAGITTGMFYRHFKTKNDLLAVVYEKESKKAIDLVLAKADKLSLQEQLIELAMALCKCSEILGPDGLLMYLHPENGRYDCGPARQEIEHAVEQIVENAKKNGELLPEGKTAKTVSDDIVLLLKGATFEWYSWGDAFDITHTMEDVFKRLMPAILNNM